MFLTSRGTGVPRVPLQTTGEGLREGRSGWRTLAAGVVGETGLRRGLRQEQRSANRNRGRDGGAGERDKAVRAATGQELAALVAARASLECPAGRISGGLVAAAFGMTAATGMTGRSTGKQGSQGRQGQEQGETRGHRGARDATASIPPQHPWGTTIARARSYQPIWRMRPSMTAL